MIKFDRFVLNNGLRVLVHNDPSTQIVAMNVLYDVGARDEHPDKTGFAHLFEHLMFEGSVNIPNFDKPLQRVGGNNNAFTTNDITNYYLTLPLNNVETGFWLESDRMLQLAFSEKKLEVQKHVVIEEFRQRYLNQPYGDTWLLLRPLAYKVHPYQWPTIGKELSHIENVTLGDTKKFFSQYYCPNNAIMVLAGNIEVEQAKRLTEKWFSGIPRGKTPERKLPAEPPQTAMRKLTVERDVPASSIHMVFHMSERWHPEYYLSDMISDVLSRGKSSRLYQNLVMERNLFSQLDAYVTGKLDPGLFIFTGKLSEGVDMAEAEGAIWDEIELLKKEPPSKEEMEKVKNNIESTTVFSEMSVLNKAMNLASFELMGNAAAINEEVDKYRAVTAEGLQEQAKKILRKENCSVLYYLGKG